MITVTEEYCMWITFQSNRMLRMVVLTSRGSRGNSHSPETDLKFTFCRVLAIFPQKFISPQEVYFAVRGCPHIPSAKFWSFQIQIQLHIQIHIQIQIQIKAAFQKVICLSYISRLASASMMLQIDCQAGAGRPDRVTDAHNK